MSVLIQSALRVILKPHTGHIRHFTVTGIRNDIFKVQDEEDFKKKVLNSKEPVVVDFFATWCGPCKILVPRLETAIGASKGKVHLAKVDVDEQDGIASDYNVSSLPTVIAIKEGKIVDQFIGVKDEDVIRAFINKLESKCNTIRLK